jgi:hypothetical protein
MKSIVPLLLIVASMSHAEDRKQCTLYTKADPEMVTLQNCISVGRNKITGGDALISKEVAINASCDKRGIAYLYSPVGIYYFTQSGLVRRTIPYDNGPDYFEEGMARTERDGKIGYFNESLKISIESNYDFGMPFQKGLALVCNGCEKKLVGEHSELMGGLWGAIDKNGNVVEPLQNTMVELFNKMPEILYKSNQQGPAAGIR